MTLMTLHNAKGLEYPIVFIVGCEDGVFPHSRAIDEGGLEEERRLFYVGITRAMRQLYLTYARRRAVFGAQTYGMRSRFLDEIPAELLDEPPGRAVPREPAVGRLRAAARRRSAAPPAWRRRRRRAAGWWAARRPASRTAEPFRLGEDVVHAAFGDGRGHGRRAGRRDRRALRRRRLRAQADGRVRPGQPTLSSAPGVQTAPRANA